MKILKALFSILLVSSIVFVVAQNSQQNNEQVKVARKCACGPTEHWLYKCCVKRYNQQFPEAQLLENNDTEGLSENVVKAIEMLAETITFLDDQGNDLIIQVSAKGNRILQLSKNSYYKACKDLLHDVDGFITLPAEELYNQWIIQLANS